MIGVRACSFVHPDDLTSAQAFFQELLSNEIITDGQFRCRHQGVEWRWIEVVGINLLTQPDIKALVLDYRDISARKHAEEQVQQLVMEQERSRLLQRFIGDISHF
jgi:PAS domain S-box-containing protein